MIGAISELNRQIFLYGVCYLFILGLVAAEFFRFFLFLKELVVFLLLKRSQRLVLFLQFHCFEDIFAFGEPQDQIIALCEAFLAASCLVIELSELISPLLDVLDFFEIFKRTDLLRDRIALGFLDLVTQHILVRIFRRQIDIFLIAILRFVGITQLQRQRPQTVDDLTAPGTTVIRKEEYFPASLIVAVVLVYFTDFAKH